MKKNLELTELEARQIFPSASESLKKILISNFGEKCFSKNILDRIDNINDIYLEAGTTEDDFMQKCKDDHLSDYEIANRQIELISTVLNEGEELDFDNSETIKYAPVFAGGASGFAFSCSVYQGTRTVTYLVSRLAYKTEKLATFSGKTFTSIYKRAIIKLKK